MTSDEKKATLLSLLGNWEDEVVEFKSGGKGFSSDEIGKYFSALSNEANLRGLEAAWLVFGVHNKTPGGQQYSQIGYVKPDADGFVTIKAGPLTVVVYKTQVWYQKMPGEAPKDK